LDYIKAQKKPGQNVLLWVNHFVMRNLAMAAVLVAGVTSLVPAAQKIRWVSYKSNLLNLQLTVPSDWSPAKIPNALAFRYDDLSGGTAAIGVLKSAQITSVTEAADKEFNQEGRPADWIRLDARVNGMKAVKITGTDMKNPDRKIVHYYVEAPQGIYLVQCQGTASRWPIYGPIFATILSKLTFL
jgi:hypothetical protein